jgi:hypothetical protein
MATVTIIINTDNAAFEDDPWDEVARILETQVARDMRYSDYYCVGCDSTKVTDLNGNTCGSVSIQED